MDNFELTECTYECIKDTFYYGLFGDFKLVIDKATGYFNATKLCFISNTLATSLALKNTLS